MQSLRETAGRCVDSLNVWNNRADKQPNAIIWGEIVVTALARTSRLRTAFRVSVSLMLLMGMISAMGCSASSPPESATLTPAATPGQAASDEGTSAADAESSDASGESEEDAEDSSVEATFTAVDQSGANTAVRNGARTICVDTRPDAEIERLSSASIVPLSSLIDYASGWRKTDPVLVTSREDAKSRSAAAYLSREGFTEVYYLDNGHDDHTGPYSGSDPRVYTNPPKVYFFWADPDKLNMSGEIPAGTEDYFNLIGGTNDSMVELASEYSGIVEFRNYEYFASPSAFESAWNSHDDVIVPWIPQWVLVDHDGRKTVLIGYPIGTSLQKVYSFCERYREAAEEPSGT